MDDVKAVVEGVVNEGLKKKLTEAGLRVFDYGECDIKTEEGNEE